MKKPTMSPTVVARAMITFGVCAIICALFYVGCDEYKRSKYTSISYDTFIQMSSTGSVASILCNDDSLIFVFETTTNAMYKCVAPSFDELTETAKANHIHIEENQFPYFFILTIVIISIGGVAVVLVPPKRVKAEKGPTPATTSEASGTQPTQAASQRASMQPVKGVKGVTFDDVAGYAETKKSMEFLVKCLENSQLLKSAGAKLPTGVLLYGPPGTGKTLMAKAIAGTAKVPFFATSASQFMDIYVGQGARNIRETFQTVAKSAPCVLFIDEIDAIGGIRGGFDGNSERRQTLDALLVELDGIQKDPAKPIITIAATNDVDHLDAALIRPGRFDRKILMPLPNREDRIAILRVHSKGKKLDSTVFLSNLADMTSGFSGAGLASMLNEAALLAVSEHRVAITKSDIDSAMFQILTGGQAKKSKDKETLRITAYHEAGHALAVKLLTNKKISRVTIVGSTSGVGGFTHHEDSREQAFTTKADIENAIMILYAGRAAENFLFRDNPENITTGAASDIKEATRLIRSYLTQNGLDDKLGLLNMDELLNHVSPEAVLVDAAQRLSQQLYQRTERLLEENINCLEAIASALLKEDTLGDDSVSAIIRQSKKARSGG